MLEEIGIYIGIASAIFGLLFFLRKLYLRYAKHRKESINFHPYITPGEVYQRRKHYIAPYFQSISPGNEDEIRDSVTVEAQELLIPHLINLINSKQSTYRHCIVLGDSGMGKTSLLLNFKYAYRKPHWYKSESPAVFYVPLGADDCNEKIQSVIDQNNAPSTVLLLDALDEDLRAVNDHDARMDELIKLTRDFKFVIMTCRTQFFDNELFEPSVLKIKSYGDQGNLKFKKFYLSPFRDWQVNLYLNRKFRIQFKNKAKAKKIVSKSPNLMVRPMLLSYIETLIKSKKEFTYTYEIYEELIRLWIERECKKIIDESKREKFKTDLYKFSRTIANYLYEQFLEDGSIDMVHTKMESFAEKHNIELSKIEMKSKSLLNRRPGGQYKFSHKSVLEYLLAINAIENQDHNYNFGTKGFTQAEKFLTELYTSKLFLPSLSNNELMIMVKVSKDGTLSKLQTTDFEYKSQTTAVKYKQLGVRKSKKKAVAYYYPYTVTVGNKIGVDDILIFKYPFKDLNPLRLLQSSKKITIEKENEDLKSLEGIEFLESLEELRTGQTKLDDLGKIDRCKNLKVLELTECQLNESALKIEFPKQLEELRLYGNGIMFSSTLKEYVNLRKLDVSKNDLQDLDFFSGLRKLESLNISYNENLSDISVLEKLPNLKELKLDGLKNIPDIQLFRLCLLNNIQISGQDLQSLNISPIDQINVLREKISDISLKEVEIEKEFESTYKKFMLRFNLTFLGLFELGHYYKKTKNLQSQTELNNIFVFVHKINRTTISLNDILKILWEIRNATSGKSLQHVRFRKEILNTLTRDEIVEIDWRDGTLKTLRYSISLTKESLIFTINSSLLTEN